MGCSSSRPDARVEELQEDWQVEAKLAEGRYAHVYSVKHKTTHRSAAMKLYRGVHVDGNSKKEAALWRKIGNHANMISFIDDFVIDGVHCIVMEKCGASLSQQALQVGMLNETAASSMCYQMASALAYLHSLNIVHRDIKPDSFLSGDSKLPFETLKLGDFGFAKVLPIAGQLHERCGTPNYMSPEMVCRGPYNLKTDVWSLGATCYHLLYGKCPYIANLPDAKSVMEVIRWGTPQPEYLGKDSASPFGSPLAKQYLQALLKREASIRTSASEVLEMPFLRIALGELSGMAVMTSELDRKTETASQSTCSEDGEGGEEDLDLSNSILASSDGIASNGLTSL